jgi:small-conductance mechanosensitive channel
VDDVLVDLVGATRLSFLVGLAMLAAGQVMPLSEKADHVVRRLVLLVTLLQAGVWGARGLRELVDRRFTYEGEGADPSRATAAQMIGFLSRAVLWIVLVLMALDNFGVNVTTLIAGLGVGGVAVALAAQNILGDLFASVSILIDKPFVVGDVIAVDTFTGAVEQIGIKTTRLRSLGGEQIVFANSDLIKSRLRNYKRMMERRVAFNVGIVYQTPPDLVAQVPGMLRAMVETQAKTRFDRAHLATLGDSALSFEIVYVVLDPDYRLAMDIQQAINLAILRQFAEKRIAFAFPTRTLHVEGELSLPRG